MTFEANILKGKYFPLGSRDRLKAVMISLMIYLPSTFLLVDLFESLHYGYEQMAVIELVTILMLYGSYLLFPRYLSIASIAKVILLIYTVFLSMTMFIPDYNAAFSLFWFATMPIASFFFLGEKEGLLWSIILLSGLILLWILSVMKIITLLYSHSLLIELIFAYLSVTYIMYIIEQERTLNEKKLNQSLEDNRLLFKEVHHRTKNNMQVMMGLLETQSFKVSDPKVKKMLSAHVDRIKSMSFVHENLYTGDSYEEVDMPTYLGEILNNLQKITQHTILIDIDYVTLGIKDSISLGLIVNEAVSNAIEHAYSAGVGVIDVTLKSDGDQCVLTVKDQGLGFNTQKEFQSLGMTLIEDLSLSLPNGRMEINVDKGTSIQVHFDARGKANGITKKNHDR